MTAPLTLAMTADPCAMPIGRGQTCSYPGDHDGGCEWPRRIDPIDAAIRRHPAGERLRPTYEQPGGAA